MADLEVNHKSENTQIVRGVVRLPPDSTPITDADEEVHTVRHIRVFNYEPHAHRRRSSFFTHLSLLGR